MESFSKSSKNKRKYSYICKKCHNEYSRNVWYVKNAEKQKESSEKWRKNNLARSISTKYDISEAEVKIILSITSCEICGATSNLCVDHCHDSLVARGRLCKNCNSGIGFLKDNVVLLENAVQYLKRNARDPVIVLDS